MLLPGGSLGCADPLERAGTQRRAALAGSSFLERGCGAESSGSEERALPAFASGKNAEAEWIGSGLSQGKRHRKPQPRERLIAASGACQAALRFVHDRAGSGRFRPGSARNGSELSASVDFRVLACRPFPRLGFAGWHTASQRVGGASVSRPTLVRDARVFPCGKPSRASLVENGHAAESGSRMIPALRSALRRLAMSWSAVCRLRFTPSAPAPTARRRSTRRARWRRGARSPCGAWGGPAG